MRSSAPWLTWLAGASVASAQSYLVDQLSFGYSGRINPQGQQSVPGFTLHGESHSIEVLSNKVILTQPSPGSARGAIWADTRNNYKEWVLDVDFRANGPERGGGNLNIWLSRDQVSTASIRTVGRFDGLALVIDRSGGGAGMIRGFLNDGTTDYSRHHNVDSLAFGHCDYSYRNLGRPSQIKVRQSQNTFKVEIDGNACFQTDKISIPPGYFFGISAASADNPDSFEVFKMVVMTEDLNAKHGDPPLFEQQQEQHQQQQQQHQQAQDHPHTNINRGGHGWEKNVPFDEWSKEDVADARAESFTSSKAQFADLHNRLQSVNHHLSTIFTTVAEHMTVGETRHAETSEQIHDVKMLLDKLSKLDKLDSLQNQILSLEREIKTIKQEMGNKVKDTENNLRKVLGDSHGTMLEHVAVQAAPKHGRLIFIIIGGQILLVAAYIWYERKKTSPKKYL